MTIWFDLDGTLADLYSVDNWLEDLINYRTRPCEEAQPMFRMCALARQLNVLRRKGIQIGIISWCSKESTEEYSARITEAKKNWLAKHMPSVEWDEIHIVDYGTPKYTIGTGILFDDEERNRDEWNLRSGTAFAPENIVEILKKLNREVM